MATPLSVQIADAVVTELRGGTFSRTFAPVRRLLPVRELSEMDSLCVTVIPRAMKSAMLSRASEKRTYTIDVGVQQRVGQDVEVDTATVMALAEEVAEHLRNRPLTDMPLASCIGYGIDPVYSPEHLEELRVATSVVTLRYAI